MVRGRVARGPILIVAVVAALGMAVLGCGGGDDDEVRGIVRSPAPDVSSLTLPDAAGGGADFPFVAPSGDVLLVYFGYMSCPDVCPTTLADIRTALHDLDPGEADRVGLAMATIDPARDSGDDLVGYVQSFVPDAHALVTTDDERLRAAANAFGASYGVQEASDGGDPDVFHSAFVYAVDDQGKLQVTWSFGTTPEDMAHDLHLLLGTS